MLLILTVTLPMEQEMLMGCRIEVETEIKWRLKRKAGTKATLCFKPTAPK
jgi:hypothetical protein